MLERGLETLIRKEWSPEQISRWTKKEMDYSVSHERIYQYILKDKQAGGSLYLHLRAGRKERNGTGPTIVVVSLKTGSVLIGGLLLSIPAVDWVIGKNV